LIDVAEDVVAVDGGCAGGWDCDDDDDDDADADRSGSVVLKLFISINDIFFVGLITN
jgi:hypothetical protein